jgi:transcription antitermination factor NusG
MQWYAIHVSSQHEMQTHNDLCARGFEAFLPQHKVRRRWSDRVKVLDMPLFPGYLFSRFDVNDRIRVLSLPGVAQIVGSGRMPIAVEDAEIESLRTLVSSQISLAPWPYLHAGQRVAIDHGPLAGVEGIVLRAGDGKQRVVVSVTLLQRAVAAEIEREWIARVN